MNNLRSKFLFLLAFSVLISPGSPALADDKGALASRLERAEAESALDANDMKPWHLKVAVQNYDAAGNPGSAGIVEEWWASPTAYRTVYKMPDLQMTEVRNEHGTYRTSGSGTPSMALRLLLTQIIHPVPGSEEVAGSVPDMRKQSFSKVSLDCIMLGQKIEGSPHPPLGLFPTYCFDPGQDSLRVSYNFGSEFIVRNALGRFGTKHIATDVTINENGVPAISGKVTNLANVQIENVDTSNVDDLVSTTERKARVAGGVMAGSLVEKVQPAYPASARQTHVSGTVVLRAIIGRDGHIHSLRFVSVPDPDLGIAAVNAVRHWTYKPYTLNGEPTEVDTTITVNFSMGS